MREIEFREWLAKKNAPDKVISDTISRIKRVERELEVDLDQEFKGSGLDELLSLFNNQGKNEAMNKRNTALPVGSVHIAAIKHAVKKYMKFLKDEAS